MALRMTEEEYAALMERRKAADANYGVPTAGKAGTGEGVGHPVGTPEMASAKRTKYGNRRTEVDGKRFDSAHEAEVYAALMLRVRAGELKCVARQVSFDLPGGIRYVADFVTIDVEDRAEVIDAKSEATRKNRVYINKRKQMRSEWSIEVREV